MSGLLFIVSAPSGTGKTTLVERLVRDMPGSADVALVHLARAAPRRSRWRGLQFHLPRTLRVDDRGGALLEHAEVFGNLYGTGAAETRRALAEGDDVVLVIDVQGARKVRATEFEHVGVFVLPPSFEVLEERLRRRSKDSKPRSSAGSPWRRRRSPQSCEYDYVVVNEDLDSGVARLRSIVEAERSKLRVMQPRADTIIESFRAATRRV